MSELRGIVRSPRRIQTDSGAKLVFGLLPSRGREVPVECMPPMEMNANEEVIVHGEYDREGTLIAKSIRNVQAPVAPPPRRSHWRTVLALLLGAAIAGSTIGALQFGLYIITLGTGAGGEYVKYFTVFALVCMVATFGLTRISHDRTAIVGALLLGAILHTLLYTLGRSFRSQGIFLVVDLIAICLLSAFLYRLRLRRRRGEIRTRL